MHVPNLTKRLPGETLPRYWGSRRVSPGRQKPGQCVLRPVLKPEGPAVGDAVGAIVPSLMEALLASRSRPEACLDFRMLAGVCGLGKEGRSRGAGVCVLGTNASSVKYHVTLHLENPVVPTIFVCPLLSP